MQGLPWRYIVRFVDLFYTPFVTELMQDLVFNAFAFFFFLVAGIFESYYYTGDWQECNMPEKCPRYYAWLAAAVSRLIVAGNKRRLQIFCFSNAILYAISSCLSLQKRFYK